MLHIDTMLAFIMNTNNEIPVMACVLGSLDVAYALTAWGRTDPRA